MKRMSLCAMMIGAFVLQDAGAVGQPTVADFETLRAEMRKNDDAGIYNPVLADGARGDFLIQLSVTPALQEIYQKQKTTQFLSVDNPKQYVLDGYCLINVIPYNTMVAMGTPDSICSYRLFCGGVQDMDDDVFYAVELCGE